VETAADRPTIRKSWTIFETRSSIQRGYSVISAFEGISNPGGDEPCRK